MPNEVKLNKDSKVVLDTHRLMMKLHYKAMGCHCEIMGMMSENMLSVCARQQPMFGILHFKEVMCRWGMTNDKGEPVI